jgi:putative ABC transport system substrate-binding protein
MKRRDFIALLGGATAAWPLSAHAQAPPKIFRIGYLAGGGGSMAGRMAATLRRGLSELGYIDGQTIAVEVRIAEGRSERIDELVSELIGLKVDVLVTGSSPGALAAKKATAPFPSLWSRPIPLGLDWWQVWRDQAET